jgi:hypothetical protein
MSGRARGRKPPTRQRKVQKSRNSRITNNGTMQIPPRLTQGTQIPRPIRVSPIPYKRLFKYQIYIATTGTQTYFNNSVYVYRPFNAATVSGGTVAVSYTPSASWLSTLAVFSYYRVNRIQFQYNSNISTTLASAPAHVSYQPGTNPSTVGSVPADNFNNSVQNSACIDLHFSTQFTYRVDKPSDISDVNGIELQGGWIPVAYVANAALTTSNGIVIITAGTAGLPIPLTTVFGVLDIVYDVSFKLPE